MNRDIVFCQIMLRQARGEAKKFGVKIPKRLTALRSGSGGGESWFLVEGLEGFQQEVNAHNAYDARRKVICRLIDEAAEEQARQA